MNMEREDGRDAMISTPDSAHPMRSKTSMLSSFFKPYSKSLHKRRSTRLQSRDAIVSRPSTEEYSDLIDYETMLDAARGLAFIHSKGYMHCDVKSLNYLVTAVCVLLN